jgi:uncharacterized membrane protein
MKRFLIFLLLFPAIATVALYAVIYILTGAVVDSLSGPAFICLLFIGPALVVGLLDWLVSRTRMPRVIAPTLFAGGVSVVAAAWAGTIDVPVFGLVGAIPAAVCSWLSNRGV